MITGKRKISVVMLLVSTTRGLCKRGASMELKVSSYFQENSRIVYKCLIFSHTRRVLKCQ